jgi:hypothetical protein
VISNLGEAASSAAVCLLLDHPRSCHEMIWWLVTSAALLFLSGRAGV